MSSLDDEKITFLHQSIQTEAAKMLKWKVDTSVQIRDKENRIQQCQGIADNQKHQIEELQNINHELTSEKRKLTQDRDELCHRIEHVGREIDVLEHQYNSLLSKLSTLKANTIQAKQMEEVKNGEFDQLVNKFTQLHLDYKRDITILTKSEDEMREKIKHTIDSDNNKQKEIQRMLFEISNKLNILNDDLVIMDNDVGDYKLKIQNNDEEFVTVSNEVKKVVENQKNVQEMNSSTENKLLGERDLLKSKETSILHDNILLKHENEETLKKNNDLEHELSVVAINGANLKESFGKESIDVDQLLKEKEVSSLTLHTQLKEVELLASKAEQIPILKDKIKVLRTDLANCEESKKVFESEVIALKKVEKCKFILEEENRTFYDNIASLEERLKESEGLVLKCNDHKSELATDFDKLSVKYDEKLLKCEEGVSMINKYNTEINESESLILELKRKQNWNEEEILRLGDDISKMEKNLQFKENEIISSNAESSCISKELSLLYEKQQKLEIDLKNSNQSNESKLKDLNENKLELNRIENEKEKLASILIEKDDLMSHNTASITDLNANIDELQKKISDEVCEKESLLKSIDLLSLNLADKKIHLQMEEENRKGKKLDLSNKLKENQQRIKQLEKDIKVSQTSINNGSKKEDQLLKQLEKKDKNLKDITIEVTKSKRNLESLENDLDAVSAQMTQIEQELTDTSKVNDNTSQLIDEKLKENGDKSHKLVQLTSEVQLKEEKFRKLQQSLKSKEKEKDMVLKKICIENEKIVEQLKVEIVELNKKVEDANNEFENVSKDNESPQKCIAQEKISIEQMEIQNQLKQDRDEYDFQMQKLSIEEHRLGMEIERCNTKVFNSTDKPTLTNLDEDELDSDEETNTARKVKPIQTPRNFVPVLRGPPRSGTSHNRLQPPSRSSGKSYLKKPLAKKNTVDQQKNLNSSKAKPQLFDDIMVCSEES